MALTVYAYDRCGTCRKARKWLDAHDIDHRVVPILDSPPDRATLESAWRRSGLPLKRFFNTSGKAYRAGGWSQRLKDGVSEAEQLDALAADPMLLKRPLALDADEGVVLVGFKEPEWEGALR
jgi:arsenate reductase (glutaredoxin)